MDLVNRPLISPTSSPASQALAERMARLQRTSLEARARLEQRTPEEQLAAEFEQDRQTKTYAELRATYGDEVARGVDAQRRLEAQEMDDRLRDRAGMEGAQDTALLFARTAVGLGGGMLGLAAKLGNEVGPGALMHGVAESGVFGEAYAEQSRKVRRQVTEGISNTTARIDAALARRMSRVSQPNERAVNAEIAAAGARNLAEYERDIAAGTPGWLAGTERELSNLGAAAGATLRNPTVLSNLVVSQLPTLGIGLGARAAVTAEQVAARAALLAERKAIREGMGTFGVTAAKVTDDIAAQAQQQLMTRNFMLGTGAAEGGGVYQQATAEILAMSPEQLAAEFPEHAERLAADPENTRAELAGDVGLPAAAMQALLAGLTSSMVARFETNLVGAGLDGVTTAGQRLSANVANVAQQGIEETIQSGGGEFAVNAAMAQAGREDVDWGGGVGASAGQGLVGGLGMAGTLQAPSMAFNAAGVALNTTVDLGETALNALMERGKQIRANAQAPVQEQAAAVAARRAEVSSAVETELQDLGQGLAEDSTLDPQVRTELGAEGLGKVSTLSRVIEAIKVEEDPAKLNQYRIFGVKTARELSQAQAQITERIEAETDPEARQRLQALNLKINELVSDESIQEMEAAMKDVPVEAIEQVFANLPADIDTAGIQANPKVVRTLDLVREMSYAAPYKVTPAVAERARILFQKTGDASPEDMRQLELALELGTAEQEFQAANQAVYKKFPKVKTAEEVRNNILETGFQTSEFRMPSLREYVGTIGAAMDGGNKERAAAAMDKLLDFAFHISRRARAFDATANAAIDTGSVDSPLDVTLPPTKDGDLSIYSMTLDKDGDLKGNTYRLILGNEKSRATIDNVFADSNLVAGYYNALAKRYPELGFAPDANDKQAPTWQDRIDLSQPRAASKPRSFAERSADKQNRKVPNAAVPVADPVPTAVADPVDAAPAARAAQETAPTRPTKPAAPMTEEIPSARAEGIDERAASSETSNSSPSDEAPFAEGKEAEIEDRINELYHKKGRGYRAFGAKSMAALAELSKMIQERLGIGMDSGLVNQWGRLIIDPASTVGGVTTTLMDGTTVVALNVNQMDQPNKEAGDRSANDRRVRTVAHELSHALDNKFWFITGSFASSHPAFQPDGVVWNEMLAAMEKNPLLAKWFGYVVDARQGPKELFAQIGALIARSPATAQEYFPNGTQLLREAVATYTEQAAGQLVPAAVEQSAAAATAEGTNRDGVSDVGASSAPKAVSRITVEQAKSLSDAGLNARINALMDKRAAKTNTAEDDATFDLLDTEMTARETAAAEAEADSNTPTSPEGEKLKQLLPKLQTQAAMEAAESFIAGTLTLGDKTVVKIPSTILARAVALAERIAAGWASYPNDGSYAEQGKWFRDKGRSVPQPSELNDLLRETYQAAEAVNRFGAPTMLTAAEASGSVFKPAILPNWTEGRRVVNGVTDMENLCLTTSRHVEWILRAHGYKAAVAYGSVNVPGGTTNQKMDHYAAMVEIDGQIFIVDQPQGELFQSTGKGNEVKILRQEFAPRFIPLADLDAAYGTVGVKFNLAANISLTALPISDFAPSAPARTQAEAASETTDSGTDDAAALAQILAEAQAALAAGRGETEEAAPDTRTLEDMAAMSEDEYIAAVNPDGKQLTDDEVKVLTAMIGIDLPEDVEQVGEIIDKAGNPVAVFRHEDGSRYAVEDGKVLAAVINQDVATLTHTLPAGRGRKLGKALLVEYLREFPFAQSGGFSAQGERARREAYRALSGKSPLQSRFRSLRDLPEGTPEELAARQAKDAALQAKYPNRTPFDFSPELETMRRRNQWLHGFTLREDFAGALRNGLAGLQERVAGLLGQKGVGADEHTALKALSEAVIPGAVELLQARLTAAAEEDSRLNGNDPQLWQLNDKLSLHATNYGQGQPLAYDPAIAEGMASAGVLWMMETLNKEYPHDDDYIASFLKKLPEDLLPAEKAVFQEGQLQEAMVTELVRTLSSVLGITPNPDASVTENDGLLQVLAADTINILISEGNLIQTKHFLLQESVANPDGSSTYISRLVPAADVEGHNARAKAGAKVKITQFMTLSHKREGGLADLRKQLGPVGVRRLSSLLDPAREQSWQFGEPGAMTEKKIRGSDQDLSNEQRKILRNQNAVAFKRNNAMVQWLMKLGREQALALFGADPDLDMEELNKVDRIRMKGIHKGWHRAWDAFEEWHAVLLHEAEVRGVSPDELPTHFRHYITSNNRVMMDDSTNPQSNKLLREIMMATISTMELGNEQHETALRLMVGQALEAAGVDGVPKIENARSHAEVVAVVDALMAEGGPLYGVWTALVQDDLDAGALMDQMVKAGFKTDGSAVKAFNALHAWAAYDMARSRGDKTVDIALAFEQDGKTDGPANAMAQVGLHRLSDTLFLNLDRAGYHIGRERTALGDVAEELGDLYGAAAEGANKILHSKLKQLREQYTDQNLPPIARKTAEIQHRGLAGALRLFARVGWFGGLSRDGLGELTESKAKRSFGKVAVTPIGYGGGTGSVAGALSRDLLEHLYAALSEGIQTGKPIPDVLANSINALITHQLYMEEVRGRRYLRAKEVAKPINFSDVSKYKELELSPVHLRALNSHMVYGAAGALRKSIGEQMDSTLEGMGKLIAAANLQSAVLQYEFDKAYAARRAELIKTKQILPEQALSRNQEKELLRDLVPKLAPIVQFKSTVAEGSEKVGLNMAETDRNAVISAAHQRGVESLFGGLSTNVSRMGFADPGVRAGALTIIGGGDASMMAVFFSKIRQFLNVWDGLETPLVELFSAGREINQAVYEAWQHDLLGEVNKQFQSKVDELRDRIAADPGLEELLERKLKLKPTDENPNPVFGYLTELASTLDTMAKETRLVKRAMSELGISIDHMAGARQPFVKDGVIIPREELVTWLQDRVEQLRAQEADIAATPASEAVVGEGESPRSRGFDEIMLVSRVDLPTITKILEARLVKEDNKVQQFVWQHIKPLLPTDLVVHRSTMAELRDRMREVFPDVELPAGRIEGGYLQGHVFLANDSTETLMHELVHAAVTGLVDRYYAKGKGLTAHQRDAVVQLEALTREFMNLDPAELNPLSGQAVDNAQRTIGSLLEQGDVAGAVNEYLAWTLTSRDISSALQRRKAPYGLGHLAQVVRKLVRKLLGLPNNPAVTTYLEATLGQFHRLTRVDRTMDDAAPRGQMLYQLLQQPGSTGETPHEVHLRAVYDELQAVLGAVPPHQVTTENHRRTQATADQLAERQRDAFLAAGFPLSKQEQMVFELTQAMFASSLQLDSRVMIALQHLQEAAVKALTVEDFMADPSSTDPAVRSVAQAQYDAVFGSAALATDSAGRSTQLANFVALALVYAPMRAKLNQLSMPKPVDGSKTADDQLRAWTTRVFDRLSDASLGLSPNLSQRAAVDMLVTRLSKIQVKWARTARSTPSAFDRLEQKTRDRLAKVGAKAGSTLQARHARGQFGGMHGYINLVLNSIRAMTTEEGARDFGEDVIATTSHLPKEVRELFAEMVGGTSVSRPVHELLNQARWKVAQVRQRLREEAPQHVRALFSKELSEETWGRLVRSVGKTDLQALLGNYSGNQIQDMLEDRTKLDTEIARLEQSLDPQVRTSAHQLANYLMTGEQLVGYGPVYRNAAAIAHQPGFGRSKNGDQKQATKTVDRLVTLRALTYLSQTENRELADLFRTERTGVEGLVKLMRQRVVIERGKHHSDRQRFNQWKGYVPVSMDPRRDVVLAGPQRGAELVAQGYVKLQNYAGDMTDPASRGLAYYAISAAGGLATYNQGALQTVEGSVMGVDHLTGATLDSAVKTLIKDPKVVARITAMKQRPHFSQAYDLLPVFDNDGVVVAYERPLSREMLDKHLAAKPDLAQSIGMWMGRQAEEEIAREFNGQVVSVLKKTWDDFKGTNRAREFVDITDPKAPATLRDTWNAIPRETQTMLLQEFGGAVMVRQEMLNNALGYRSPSVGDAFTGMSDLPKAVREGIVNVASALLGKNAYRYLVAAERSWQSLIGTVKDVIVVRSGVVALANGISNQFQLYVHTGVAPWKQLAIQAAKVVETKAYLRNAHRIARIQVELDSTTDLGKRRGLERERQGLHDQNRRMSIWPLIKAGELPTIAEGLTEQDEYTILGDAMGWLEKKAESLPQGVVTAAKYAVISKDTALYQGMNRMIQFSDFVAKAALYDHLVQQRGLDQAEALGIISERFVNYNLLAGRSRDYLESMGLTWFMHYKIRIQKVVLSALRENPLRFLMAGVGADWLGANSLMSSSFPMTHWEAAMGPGMLFRADDALLWSQLMQ